MPTYLTGMHIQFCGVVTRELLPNKARSPACWDLLKHSIDGFIASGSCKPDLALAVVSGHTNQMNTLHSATSRRAAIGFNGVTSPLRKGLRAEAGGLSQRHSECIHPVPSARSFKQPTPWSSRPFEERPCLAWCWPPSPH
jgi:hypothetical protein